MSTLIDLTGMKFGEWTVLERAENRGGAVAWKCRCSCGAVQDVIGDSLKRGDSTGCRKCIWKHKDHPRMHKDGSRRWVDGKKTHIYSTWCGMRQRCNNTKNKSYKNYGGRGIKICDEWNRNFQAFFDYVSRLDHYGEEGRTIDRIDNSKGYEPGNVKWSTRSEQERNKRFKKNPASSPDTERLTALH